MQKKTIFKYGSVGILGCLVIASAFYFTGNPDSKTTEPASNKPEQKQQAITKSPEIPADEFIKKKVEELRPKLEAKKKAAAEKANQDPVIEATDALTNPFVDKRVKAVLSLRDATSPEAVDILTQFLYDPDEIVVQEAIKTLGHIALNTDLRDLIFDVLAEKTLDKNFPARGSTLVIAAMIGEESLVLPLIGDFLLEEDEGFNDAAVRAMAFVATPDCVPYLAQIIEISENEATLKNAYGLLAKIGTPEAAAILANNLYSDDPRTETASAWAMSRRNDPQYIQSLSEAIVMNQLDSETIQIIASSPAAPQIYADVLQSDSTTDENKVALLEVVASDGFIATGGVRDGLAKAILPLLNSGNPRVEKAAIDTLGKLNSIEDQTAVLAPKLESDSYLIQESAMYAFAKYMTPQTYKPMKELWYHEDEKMRRTAFFFTEPFLNDSDMEDLEKATEHKDEHISKQASLIIKNLKNKEAIAN